MKIFGRFFETFLMTFFVASLLLCFTAANAAINAAEFDTPQQSERYKKLIDELRCLVCQNQNLADSDADLAVDLKNIVEQKIIAGETDDQIRDFMTQRYGDFVLYRPPFKANTLLLWLGPTAFLVIGLFTIFGYIKRRKTPTFVPTKEQQKKVRKLLDQ